MYDVAIVGGGPGGYGAAFELARHGASVLLCEQDRLGGVCLNRGCIPSKALLRAARVYRDLAAAAGSGIVSGLADFDVAAAVAHKDGVVERLRTGLEQSLAAAGVTVRRGTAHLTGRNELTVDREELTAANIIIATGSRPRRLAVPGSEFTPVMTNREFLDQRALLNRVVIVGGGAVGCEFAQILTDVGVEIDLVEMASEILPGFEPALGRGLRANLPDVRFHLDATVVTIGRDGVEIEQEGARHKIEGDRVVVAVGRRPNVEGLGLEDIGIDWRPRGIIVNDRMETNLPGVYAVGDVTGRSMLAHAATRMGEVAARVIQGHDARVRFGAIPAVVYTHPEVAAVGLTRIEATNRGLDAAEVRMPLTANGRFLAEATGMKRCSTSIVYDRESRVLLGAHLIGPAAGEIIFGIAAMIEDEFRLEDVSDVVFPHPTFGEVLRDLTVRTPPIVPQRLS